MWFNYVRANQAYHVDSTPFPSSFRISANPCTGSVKHIFQSALHVCSCGARDERWGRTGRGGSTGAVGYLALIERSKQQHTPADRSLL